MKARRVPLMGWAQVVDAETWKQVPRWKRWTLRALCCLMDGIGG